MPMPQLRDFASAKMKSVYDGTATAVRMLISILNEYFDVTLVQKQLKKSYNTLKPGDVVQLSNRGKWLPYWNEYLFLSHADKKYLDDFIDKKNKTRMIKVFLDLCLCLYISAGSHNKTEKLLLARLLKVKKLKLPEVDFTDTNEALERMAQQQSTAAADGDEELATRFAQMGLLLRWIAYSAVPTNELTYNSVRERIILSHLLSKIKARKEKIPQRQLNFNFPENYQTIGQDIKAGNMLVYLGMEFNVFTWFEEPVWLCNNKKYHSWIDVKNLTIVIR